VVQQGAMWSSLAPVAVLHFTDWLREQAHCPTVPELEGGTGDDIHTQPSGATFEWKHRHTHAHSIALSSPVVPAHWGSVCSSVEGHVGAVCWPGAPSEASCRAPSVRWQRSDCWWTPGENAGTEEAEMHPETHKMCVCVCVWRAREKPCLYLVLSCILCPDLVHILIVPTFFWTG
jgi:hypothetical protein